MTDIKDLSTQDAISLGLDVSRALDRIMRGAITAAVQQALALHGVTARDTETYDLAVSIVRHSLGDYAFDEARDKIAKGVTVGVKSVVDMRNRETPAQRRARIDEEFKALDLGFRAHQVAQPACVCINGTGKILETCADFLAYEAKSLALLNARFARD